MPGGEVEAEQDALQARLAQETGLLERASAGQRLLEALQQDIVVTCIAALSEWFHLLELACADISRLGPGALSAHEQGGCGTHLIAREAAAGVDNLQDRAGS